jgi:hypothetical protein
MARCPQQPQPSLEHWTCRVCKGTGVMTEYVEGTDWFDIGSYVRRDSSCTHCKAKGWIHEPGSWNPPLSPSPMMFFVISPAIILSLLWLITQLPWP